MARNDLATIEVVGLKEALREINSYDKKLRRSLTREYAQIVQPAIDETMRLIPVKAPMTGWERSWTPRAKQPGANTRQILPWGYGTGRSKDKIFPVKPFLSGKTPKTTNGYTRNLAVMGYRWADKRAVLFDMTRGANTPQGQQMVRVLNERYGFGSRAMWRAYQQAGPDVQDEIRRLVERIMRQASQQTRKVKVVK